MFVVYMILNLINGKIYVGQTNNFKRRKKKHIFDSYKEGRSKPVHKAIRKYGINNFDFRIVQEINSFNEALLAEKYWISFYKSNIIRYGKQFGYNLSDGGDGGGCGPKSQTHKDNISKSLKGKPKSEGAKINARIAQSKLTTGQLDTIKKLLIDNVSEYTIANIIGVSQGIISDIKIGKTYTHIFTKDDLIIFNSRVRSTFGEKNAGSKLKEHQVIEIKSLLNNGESTNNIMKTYNISRSQTLRIKNGESWSYLK